MDYTKEEFALHSYKCGSRTETCEYCGKNIILRHFALHSTYCFTDLVKENNNNSKGISNSQSDRSHVEGFNSYLGPPEGIDSPLQKKKPVRKGLLEDARIDGFKNKGKKDSSISDEDYKPEIEEKKSLSKEKRGITRKIKEKNEKKPEIKEKVKKDN